MITPDPRPLPAALDRCAICNDPNPTLVRAEEGPLCDECCDLLDSGEAILEGISAPLDAINSEDSKS